MTLELFTAIGRPRRRARSRSSLDERLLSFLFAGLLVYVAFTMARAATAPPGRAPTRGRPDADPASPTPTAGATDRPRPAVRRGLPRPQPRPRAWSERRRGRGLGAARDRRRDRQGPADEPGDGRPAPGRDGDQQHDDRHHRRPPARSSTCPRRASTRTSPARPRSACSSARPSGRASRTGSTSALPAALFVVVLGLHGVPDAAAGRPVTGAPASAWRPRQPDVAAER